MKIEKDKDIEKEKVGDRPVKLNEKKRQRDRAGGKELFFGRTT